MKYRPEIDGLRAIAVISVILYHAGFSWFSGGFLGVDVFFVISGFLITSILITDLSQGKLNIIRFYERRARRILPALFLVILVSIPPAWILFLPQELEAFSRSILAVVLFVSNILFWRESGYFDSLSVEKPLLHTWSLAVEEQYYLLFPLFMALVWRLGRRSVAALLVLIAMLSLALSQWASANYGSANFYLLPTRAWQLLFGSISAILASKVQLPRHDGIAIVGLAMIVFSILMLNSEMNLPGLLSVIPVLGTTFVLLFAHQDSLTARILSIPFMVKIGLISYSAYLWHQPIFAYSRIYSFEPLSFGIRASLILVSLVLAYFSWRFVETPFRSQKRISNLRLIGIISPMALVLILFSIVNTQTIWLEKIRFSADERSILDTISSSPVRDICHAPQSDTALFWKACVFNEGGISTTAVIGNSHAAELAYALGEVRSEKNIEVRQYSISDCPHVFTTDLNEKSICQQWHEVVLAEVINDPRISQVILSYRNDHFMDEEYYLESLTTMIYKLLLADKEVVLVLQAPLAERAISSYLRLHKLDNQTSIPSILRADWETYYSPVLSYVTKLLGTMSDDLADRLSVVDPANLFCDEEQCFVLSEGSALYFDDNHMSVSGALRIAQTIPLPLVSDQ